jgi:hypothetical protein
MLQVPQHKHFTVTFCQLREHGMYAAAHLLAKELVGWARAVRHELSGQVHGGLVRQGLVQTVLAVHGATLSEDVLTAQID